MKHRIFSILLSLLAFTSTVWADGGNWELNPYDFQYDMTAYIGLNVDGADVDDMSRYSVAAFCGDECRGIMEVKTAGDVQYGYLRIRSNKDSGEQITFKVYDNTADVLTKCVDVMEFQAQGLQGMPSSPIILHAANKYKVNYVVDNEIVQSDEVYYGESLPLIDGPDKTGYTFDGWSGLPETMPAHDVTVTGSYTVNTYTLTFKIGDDVISEMTVAYGSEIVEPTAPEKEGHTFAGWDEHPATMPTSNLTISGSYTVNSYKLTYMIGETVISESDVEYGATLTAIEAPTKEGHTFDGWTGLPETMPAHDVTVTGSYTVNTYTLTFKIGEDVISETTVAYGLEIVEPTVPEKEGHTFAGWEEHPAAMPANNLTISGSYTVNSYKLTYMIGETVISESDVEYGAPLTAIKAPTKEGYTFDGWSGLPETMPAHDVTVTGSYTVNTYTLTFKIGDDVISETTVAYGSEIVEPAAPEKEGHTFAGWEEHPATMPANNLTINGSYTVNSYKLTYMIGETVISESDVEYGAPLTAIEAPTKEGHTFGGWSGLPETMPAHDVTVTGSYTVNTYTLTFKIGEDVISETMVAYGSEIVEPTTPEKEGHTFVGWDEHPATMPASNLTISGSYTVNSYKLTYMIDESVISESDVEYGTTLTAIDAPTKEGHTFDGWSGLPETMPAHDVEVNGSFTVNTYTLTFNSNGGSEVAPIVLDYGSAITAPADPTREGYTFAGWDKEIPATMPAENMEFTAQWTINSYKLIYKVDNVEYKSYEVEYGKAIEKEAEPTRTGYTFSGWSEIPETMPAHDVEVNGSFDINQYTITFDTDGGSEVDPITQDYGTVITAPADPTREGYTFAGWDMEIPETMPAEDLVLTAQWTANSYKLIYKVDNAEYKSYEIEYGEAIEKEAEPTRTGYTFSGWSEIPETMPAHDVEVNGSFYINQYTITFDTDGGSEVDPITQDYGTVITAPEDPTREGYTFAGWDMEIPETMPAEDLELTALWTVNSYKLTYYVDGEVYKEYEVDYGTAIVPEEEPVKEGYKFSGWSEIIEEMPAHDVAIYGTFEIETGITHILGDVENVDVYDINGKMLLHGVSVKDIREKLGYGLYIINGKKVMIK